ncbi:MAG: metallophosphoesterase family protein [Lentisphaeria bacterium]|nr:metallophosphoesterase family protein [Lentisphaeria bacterium]
MKIALISDIHANLAALEAVLARIAMEDCVKTLCCGDIVGYGPYPRECLALIQKSGIACVLGNHDDMMRKPDRVQKMRPDVRDALNWTREQLTDEEIQWLGRLPRTMKYGGFELVHASNVISPRWHYVIDRRSVTASFLFQNGPLVFNGHSHVPILAAHRTGERPRMVELKDMTLPAGYRFMVNVGSVGQPRDRNPKASFVTFETRDRSLRIHRVAYDISATQSAMVKAGLPRSLILRLSEGR